jgi:hypothetical protein
MKSIASQAHAHGFGRIGPTHEPASRPAITPRLFDQVIHIHADRRCDGEHKDEVGMSQDLHKRLWDLDEEVLHRPTNAVGDCVGETAVDGKYAEADGWPIGEPGAHIIGLHYFVLPVVG